MRSDWILEVKRWGSGHCCGFRTIYTDPDLTSVSGPDLTIFTIVFQI